MSTFKWCYWTIPEDRAMNLSICVRQEVCYRVVPASKKTLMDGFFSCSGSSWPMRWSFWIMSAASYSLWTKWMSLASFINTMVFIWYCGYGTFKRSFLPCFQKKNEKTCKLVSQFVRERVNELERRRMTFYKCSAQTYGPTLTYP